MASTIKIKNSSTAGAAPTTSDLVQGELAVNVTDKRIYTENASGTVVELGTNPSIPVTFSAGSAAAPALTTSGDTDTGVLFPAANTVAIATAGSERARIDSAGNLGIGVSPSGWGSSLRAIQIGGSNGYISYNNINGGYTYWNMYNDGTNNKTYATGNIAAYGLNTSGQHVWFNGTGTTGATSSLTQAMTLDASGNLGVGATSINSMVHLRRDTSSGSSTSYPNIRIDNPNAAGYSGLYFYADTTQKAGFEVSNSVGALQMLVANAERARIDSSGNLLVGVTSGSYHSLYKNVAKGTAVGAIFGTNGCGIIVYEGDLAGQNAAATILAVHKNSSTSRSINAAGTINASGADYAEYMTKAGDFSVAKGDVIGINADGKLTNVFANAVSFAVKSTDPSYVGGDVWGSEEAIGLTKPEDDATDEEKATFEAALEAARQTVDRIAFAGQVPVNVTGATAGQFIVPTDNNGAIIGVAVNEADMTLSQYMKAVGKVIAIEQDGRAKIIVKVA